MCGIFGYIGKRENAAEIVLEGLKSLEYRGYDSWGVAVVSNKNNELQVKKKTGKIGEATVVEMPASSFGFGHTRWATHGGVTDKNAHPHLDCTKKIAIIHNGIIENYDSLKKNLMKKGHTFISETDSEVVSHLIEDRLKNHSLQEAVRTSFLECDGLNALIAFHTTTREFVAIRNGSPLVVGFGKGENYIASDPAALLPHTKDVYFLEDNEMAVVAGSEIKLFDALTGKKRTIAPVKLSWNITSANEGTFPHYMIKEIHEQPEIMMAIASEGVSQASKMAAIINKSYGTYFIGCGTASYACVAASYLFSKIAKHHINWAVGSEFSYHLDFLTKKSLVVALSQSGETMDILESVKAARRRGATIGALVNVFGSTLYRLADDKFLIGAGVEKGVASTKAFIGKLSYLLLVAYALAGKVTIGNRLLMHAAEESKELLTGIRVKEIQQIARMIKDSTDIYVIGRGLSYPASLEAALKIKEISYIHAEGLAAGELKHGPLALVEKGTPCIVIAPNDETYGANLAGAMEMKARGGRIIGISYKNHEIFDSFIKVGDVGDASIIPSVIASQILAYYLAVYRGFDPDKPRNLAKSVTVK